MFSLLRDLLDERQYDRSANCGVVPGLLLDNYLDCSSPRVHYHVSRPHHRHGTGAMPDARNDPSKYQVLLNVKHFRPEEIDVKIVDNSVVIHGRHEEHADQHGFVSREFTRRYQLPDDVEPATVRSSLSQNGVLSIQAPRKQLEPPPKNERVVPITIQQPAAVEEAQQQQQQEQEQAAHQQNSDEQ